MTICKDIEALGKETAKQFARLAEQYVTQKGRFTVALSGGSTPQVLYKYLSLPPIRSEIPWGGIHIFWGDERMVPPDHPDSNFRMANEILLKKVPIPDENIFAMPMKETDPDRAAEMYEAAIHDCFDPDEDEIPVFDLILLGIGEDGHTASLFPQTAALNEEDAWVAKNYVPKLDKTRLTLTFPLINQAKNIFFLASGEKKAPVIQGLLSSTQPAMHYPAAKVKPVSGKLSYFIDEAAASGLPKP